MKSRPRGRSTWPRERALRRLSDPSVDPGLRAALRDSTAGEVVTVHAAECAMGEDCSCVPVALVVGAVA